MDIEPVYEHCLDFAGGESSLAALGAFILYLIVKSIIENIKLALIHYIVEFTL